MDNKVSPILVITCVFFSFYTYLYDKLTEDEHLYMFSFMELYMISNYGGAKTISSSILNNLERNTPNSSLQFEINYHHLQATPFL